MKRIIIIMCFVVVLFGMSHSVGWALSVGNLDALPNSVNDMQRLEPIHIPDFSVDVDLWVPILEVDEDESVDEDAPLHHPMRRGTLMIAEKLIEKLGDVHEKIERTEYFSSSEKKDILNSVKKEREAATQLKAVIMDTHNFEDVKGDVIAKLDGFILGTQRSIPKAIIENRMEHKKSISDQLDNVSSKLEFYIDDAKKTGEDMEDAEKELEKMKEQLIAANSKLGDVYIIIGKIKNESSANNLRQYRQDSDVILKNARKNLKKAKDSAKDVVDELERIVK